MALSLIALFSMFGFGQSKNEYIIKPIFSDMRNMAFSINPKDIGLTNIDDSTIFAVFMEMGYPEAVVSLRCFADGSISIYFTNGGGMIGIGEQPEARIEGLKLLNIAPKYIKVAKLDSSKNLPQKGYTKFYFRTLSGDYSYEELETKLGQGNSEYSTLFYQAQMVITKARESQEKRK